jgi:hypothetical protein
MNETVENPIPGQPFAMRGGMAAMRPDATAGTYAMEDGFADVRGRGDGMATRPTPLTGHGRSSDDRVETAEEARG